MFKSIVLGFDGSEGSQRALERAVEIAAAWNSRVHLVAVGRLPEYAETEAEVDAARKQAQGFYGKHLTDALALLERRGVPAEKHIAFGKPSDQILRTADAVAADLIIIGTHAHHPIRRRLLGATADNVVDLAECSVMIVK